MEQKRLRQHAQDIDGMSEEKALETLHAYVNVAEMTVEKAKDQINKKLQHEERADEIESELSAHFDGDVTVNGQNKVGTFVIIFEPFEFVDPEEIKSLGFEIEKVGPGTRQQTNRDVPILQVIIHE